MNSIYCIVNNVDGKKYIGKSSNSRKRFIMHRCLLNKNKHWNKHLQRAWNRDGENNFEFFLIADQVHDNELNEKEKYYIEYFKTRDENFGYNKTKGRRWSTQPRSRN